MTTGTLDDRGLEQRLRSTLRSVADQTVVGDELADPPPVPLPALASVRTAGARRRRSRSVVAVAAGLLVALVVAAGVVRSTEAPDVVSTPGAPAPASAPEGGTWPATPTRYCVGWVDVLNARWSLDFGDTAGRDRFMDAMAALSRADVRTAWADRSALIPTGAADVGLAQPVADVALGLCPTRTIAAAPTDDPVGGRVELVDPATADAVFPEDASDVSPPVTTTADPPIDGESLWPADAPADYCSGYQHFLDVQVIAPGPTSVQTEGFRRYTNQLAALAPGDIGPLWLELRSSWSAQVDPDPPASHEVLYRIHHQSTAICPGSGIRPVG